MSLITQVQSAQRTASDPARSIWVRANAGSGKTRVLVERILRILLSGTPPDRVLALTFTKAAAAEMKDRLFTTLGKWTAFDEDTLIETLNELEGKAPSQDKLNRARRLFARALETPGGLKVQTIHGFCQAMLERFPIEAAVPPHFTVLDDAQGAELRHEAKTTILATLDEPLTQALTIILDEVGEVQFHEVMDDLLARRGLFHHARTFDPQFKKLHKRLGLPEGVSEELHTQSFQDAIPLDLMRQAGPAMIDVGKGNPEKFGRLIARFCETGEGFEEYLSVFVTAAGGPRGLDRVVTQKVENRDHILAVMEAEQDRVLTYLNHKKAFAALCRTRALHELGGAILNLYDRAKALRGVLDYDDLIIKAAELLERGADWVLYKLDQGIDHILVDEAQDTSPDQWRVVTALAHEFFTGAGARADVVRTVFAVGDEKQSIYSFQGADPRGFALTEDKMAEAAAQAGMAFDAVSLPVSFRSAPPILELVDEVSSTPAIREGLTHDGLEVIHQPFREGHAGSVELWPLIEPEEDPGDDPWDVPLDMVAAHDPKAKLARKIAATIRGWLDTQTLLEARGRPITPGDIVVLVRKRDVFVEALVRELKAHKVPVAGTDRIRVTEQIAVMDLIAAAQFTLLPSDDLTLATLLRSPLIGLSEDQLFELAHNRPGSLWQAVQTSDLDDAKAWLEHLIKAARRLRPADFFQHVLSVMGGRKRLESRLGAQVHDPVDEFLALARTHEEQNAPSLQNFLHWVAAAGAEIKRDMERGTGQVRIMTVHGAKGLEANVVILPDTMSPPSGRNTPPLLKLNPDSLTDPLFVWARSKDRDDPATATARQAYRDSQMREYHRLLYVALTRARDRLIVCGYRGKRDSADPGWHTMLTPAFETLGDEQDGVWRYQTRQSADTIAEDAEPVLPLIPKTPDWLFKPAPPEPAPSRPLTPSKALIEEPPARSPLHAGHSGDAKLRGTLIHRLLELLPDCAPKSRLEIGRQFLGRTAAETPQSTRENWLSEALSILDDPAFARVFGPGSLAEVPVSGLVPDLGEGLVLSGQIDRLVITDDEILLVDFKTNRPPPERVEDVAPAYLIQMASYRAALRTIYPGTPIRTGLLWTDAPKLMALPDPLLDAAESRARKAVMAAMP